MKVRIVRKNIWKKLIEVLGNYSSFVGEVAWISDPHVLKAMSGKCLGFVTQDRPISKRLKNRYLNTLSDTIPETVVGINDTDLTALGQIRKYGTFHDWGSGFQKGPKPFFMHRKVLIMGDMEAHSPYWMGGNNKVHWVFTPKAVWTGSYNMTMAARKHCEHAVYIQNEVCAQYEIAEFWKTYKKACGRSI